MTAKCPICGDAERVNILARVWVRVCDDGTDATGAKDSSHEWSDNSPAQCDACGWIGVASSCSISFEGS